MADIKNFEFDELTPIYHADLIISFGELLEAGVIDWQKEKWQWNAYNEEQFKRCCDLIENIYFTRELRFSPIELWRKRFIAKANLLMQKLKPVYEFLEDEPNFFQNEHEYEKERNIESAFPQTMLSGNSDYASAGQDKERELIKDGNTTDILNYLYETYVSPDEFFVNGLEPLFLQTFTTYVNGL